MNKRIGRLQSLIWWINEVTANSLRHIDYFYLKRNLLMVLNARVRLVALPGVATLHLSIKSYDRLRDAATLFMHKKCSNSVVCFLID